MDLLTLHYLAKGEKLARFITGLTDDHIVCLILTMAVNCPAVMYKNIVRSTIDIAFTLAKRMCIIQVVSRNVFPLQIIFLTATKRHHNKFRNHY